MRARGLLLAALLLCACASDASSQSGSTILQQSAGPLLTQTSVTATSATSATSVTETTATETSVTPTATSTTTLPAVVDATSVTATSVTGTSVTETTAGREPADDERPFEVYVPSSYDGSNAVPLILLLHGYTVRNDLQEAYFNIQPIAEERGFLYVHPQGTIDQRGNSFWNATDGCCNFYGSSVDDSAYLASLIADVQSRYQVDSRRIYVIGHSNGGFMSYRMACDHADTIAAIVSLAGATFDDASDCAPTQPVSVLQIHGTADGVIRYGGGGYVGPYPSAPTSVQTWAAYDGCAATPVQADAGRDLDRDIEGDDTTVSHFSDCPAGIDVELWSIQDGSHIPALSSTFTQQAIDFLYAHPKP